MTSSVKPVFRLTYPPQHSLDRLGGQRNKSRCYDKPVRYIDRQLFMLVEFIIVIQSDGFPGFFGYFFQQSGQGPCGCIGRFIGHSGGERQAGSAFPHKSANRLFAPGSASNRFPNDRVRLLSEPWSGAYESGDDPGSL